MDPAVVQTYFEMDDAKFMKEWDKLSAAEKKYFKDAVAFILDKRK